MSIAFDEPDLGALVRERIERWRSGQQPDAAAFLSEHPEVESSKSLVLDLIYEELCLRSESGDTLVKSTICDRFPAYRQSIVKMLEVQDYLDQCPPEGEAAAASWPEPGEHFMGYDLVSHLGRGALARVYFAREPALGHRPVVVKVSRFGAREAETLGRLSHDNIVPIHSVRYDADTGWTTICMPLLGTATAVDLLAAALGRGRPPADGTIVPRVGSQTRPIDGITPSAPAHEVRQWRGAYADAIARLGLQLAEGLHAAHAAGVMHRDIKPSNVLLAWSGRPMLLDFNLSTDQQAPEERIGGTLAYMAPEQIASLQQDGGASARQFDPRGDVYSLGALLYELLTGRLPARPDQADELPPHAYGPWLEAKRGRPAPLRSHQPRIDRRLEAIVLTCLAADPGQRYATAAELAKDLRAYLGVVPRATRFVKRRPLAVLAALLAAIGLTVAAWAAVAALPAREAGLIAAGIALAEQGELTAAEQSLRAAIDIQPGSLEARFALAQTLRRQQRWAEAREAFLALADQDERWSCVLAGDCALADRRWAEANQDFLRADLAGNRHPAFLLRYAYAARQEQRFPRCFELYAKVLADEPESADALRGRALAWRAVAAHEKQPIDRRALDDAERAYLLQPTLKSAHVAVIVYSAALKDSPELRGRAADHVRAALELGLPLRELRDPLLAPLVAAARRDLVPLAEEHADYRLVATPDEPLSDTADWQAFLRLVEAGD